MIKLIGSSKEENVSVNVSLKIEILWRDPPGNDSEQVRRDMIQKTMNDQAKDLAIMIHNIVTGKEKPNIIKLN